MADAVTLRELAAAVRERRIGAHELVARSLERIETLDADLNAVVALRAEEALEEARGLDAALSAGAEAGPLAGLPLLVKDMTDVAGMRTTFGSQVFGAAPAATTDAVVVARLRAAGAIVVGKTNLPEFAAEGFTSNLLFGTTCNPWLPDRTCGGSSGGSAVALAAGMAAIATATDGGGSIRIPAAYCGLVGLKPTNGVVGRDPIPDWIDLSTDGPFSTCADDLELLLEVLRGPTPGDPTAQVVPPPERDTAVARVFTIERFTDYGPLPAEVREPFDAAVTSFGEVVGRAAEPITPSQLFGDRRIDEDWFTITGSEHAHRFGRAWFDEHAEQLHPSTRSYLEGGLAVPDRGVPGRAVPAVRVHACARRSAWRRRGAALARDDRRRLPRRWIGRRHRSRVVRVPGAEHHGPPGVIAAGGRVSERCALRAAGDRASLPRRPPAGHRATVGGRAAVAANRARLPAVRRPDVLSRRARPRRRLRDT